MKLTRLFAGLSAAAFAAVTAAMPAAAEAAEIPADENGVYASAGIIWMIQDQWDHKKNINSDPTDEFETTTISGTYHNVNITGNGQYTVDMSGYHAPQDWLDIGVLVGYLGVEMEFDFDTYPDVTFAIDEATIDGTKYTFTQGINPETDEPYQVLEEPESTDASVMGEKIIKIKNSYGNPLTAEPEMTSDAWKTTDTISVTFTVSGLPTDKVEGYANEVVEQVYGSGSIDNDPAEGEEAAAESAAECEDGAAEESAAEDGADLDKGAAEADKADADKDSEEKSSVSPAYIAGFVVGVAVVAVVVAVIVVKKKR